MRQRSPSVAAGVAVSNAAPLSPGRVCRSISADLLHGCGKQHLSCCQSSRARPSLSQFWMNGAINSCITTAIIIIITTAIIIIIEMEERFKQMLQHRLDHHRQRQDCRLGSQDPHHSQRSRYTIFDVNRTSLLRQFISLRPVFMVSAVAPVFSSKRETRSLSRQVWKEAIVAVIVVGGVGIGVVAVVAV